MKKLLFTGILALIAVCGGLYALRHQDAEQEGSGVRTGSWNASRYEQHPDDADDTYSKLIGLGYLEGYKAASGSQGVTVFDRGRAYHGLNFFVSGHAPEALLMDMEGKILHTWRYKNAAEIWKYAPEQEPGGYFWRRAHLFQNGDILAIYEGLGLIKLDKNSNLIWSYASSRAPHHDLEVLDNGTIYTLTRERKRIDRLSSVDVCEEYITVLSPQGQLLKEYSLIDLIENSPYARMLINDSFVRAGGFYGHILHANTIEVFDGSRAHMSPLFKTGNMLISILITNTVCIVDLEKEQVVWALGSGLWRHQHQPTLLENGNILIFDNKDHDNASAVKEFNPFSQKIAWVYQGSPERPFFSITCGSNQRLPNGNTLITETDNGRAFEVTPDKEIVWEYINPFRGGEKKELIASLFEMIRVHPEATFL